MDTPNIMGKTEIVRCLRLANNLWAIEGANPYSVRAHAISADAILESSLSIEQILHSPPSTIHGVGRETLAMVQALMTGGMQALLRRLEISIPVTTAELLQLPGIGPKTAHTLVHSYNIFSAEDLRAALKTSKITHIPGLGPKRLARLHRDLAVFLERKHSLPVAVAWPFANQIKEHIEQLNGVEDVAITGALRRLVVMVSKIEIVVGTVTPQVLYDWVTAVASTQTESKASSSNHTTASTQTSTQNNGQTAGQSASQSTAQFGRTNELDGSEVIDVSLNFQAAPVPLRLYVVKPNLFATTLMKTTGDETHQAVIEGLLKQKDITWSGDGLVWSQTSEPVDVATEEEIYALLGLPYFPPEVREGQGLLCQPTKLVTTDDIRGDLHVHSTWSDGSMSISEIAAEADKLGYEYIAITDHSQSLTIAGGLSPADLERQHVEIERVQKHTRAKLFHGVEVDILSDGRLDLPDETLHKLFPVIASVHSSMQQSKEEMTERVLRAVRHPAVNFIGHLTGRILGRRSGYELDIPLILEEAFAHGVLLELNANPHRLDISEDVLRSAKEMGLSVPINTDTHHPQEFANMAYGVRMAQRGWLHQSEVLNTLPLPDLLSHCRRKGKLGK